MLDIGPHKPLVRPGALDRGAPERLDQHALVRLLHQRPDDRKAWLVYADWLLDRGDPRGEIIAAAARYQSVDELHRQHASTLLGPFERALACCAEFTWHMAHWKSARVLVERAPSEGCAEDALVVEHVLDHGSARFLRELRVEQGEGWVEALARRGARPGLRRLSARRAGDLSRLWAVLPDLEQLELDGALQRLGPVEAPRLRSLVLRTPGLDPEPLQRLAEAALPSLESLELWLSVQRTDREPGLRAIRPLLAGAGLPRLRRLSLRSISQADLLVELLLDSPLLPRLQHLDLSWGGLTDQGGRRLLSDPARLGHLRSLQLDGNFLGPELQRQLSSALRQASVRDQGYAGDDQLALP